MGQHKYNPTAIAAKNGELPPKPKKMDKREAERLLYAKCAEMIYKQPMLDALNVKLMNDFYVYKWKEN